MREIFVFSIYKVLLQSRYSSVKILDADQWNLVPNILNKGFFHLIGDLLKSKNQNDDVI